VLADEVGVTLFDEFANWNQDFARSRHDDVFGGGAAEDALCQRDDDLTGVDDGLDVDAAVRAAIVFKDDGILGDVDETARQVAGVRGLQRRVGETLTRPVGGVEVFENREAFLEVRDDRRLDDFARGLGHEAAHGGQLAHRGWASRAHRNGSSCRSS